jgi:hypothetical protein
MSIERRLPQKEGMERVAIGATVIAMAVVIALAGAWGLIVSFGGTPRAAAVRPAPVPAPALEPQPLADRRAYEAKQTQALREYAWIDRDKGIVRIPIDAAMAALSKRAAMSGSGESRGSP